MKRTVIDARGDVVSLKNIGHRQYDIDMTPEQEAQYERIKSAAAEEARQREDEASRQKRRDALLDRLLAEEEARVAGD